jgi:hypothetical protein
MLLAARFKSMDGSCSGCTSSFPQSAAIKLDQPYEFYTCNLPQGMAQQNVGHCCDCAACGFPRGRQC